MKGQFQKIRWVIPLNPDELIDAEIRRALESVNQIKEKKII